MTHHPKRGIPEIKAWAKKVQRGNETSTKANLARYIVRLCAEVQKLEAARAADFAAIKVNALELTATPCGTEHGNRSNR